jgi:hypothetical protein
MNGTPAGVTWPTLNGAIFWSNAAARGALAKPTVKTTATGATFEAEVDNIPTNLGSFDETVLAAGAAEAALWAHMGGTPILNSPVPLAPGESLDVPIPLGPFFALAPGSTYRVSAEYGDPAPKISGEGTLTVR